MIKNFFTLFAYLVITGCGGGGSNDGSNNKACTTLDCKTLKYSLLLADVDFSNASPQVTNVQVVATNSYQDMTHPRVSTDKLWVAYTQYNDTNTDGCASTDTGYVNTEIMAASLDGVQQKTILSVTTGELTSNNWGGIIRVQNCLVVIFLRMIQKYHPME